MPIDRRRFLGATFALSVAACTARVAPPQLAVPRTPEPPPTVFPPPRPQVAVAAPWQGERPALLDEAIAALDRHYTLARDRLVLVDFTRHSSEPRLHLVDLARGRVEKSLLVAHGSGSDPAHSGMLQRFSNVPGSNASSDGAYLTSEFYTGQHGLSQRLIGLDESNNMAFDRAIVLHGADYVAPALVAAQGRIGRSQGCFALEQGEIAGVMQALGQGRLIFAGKLA